jgi:hypothetical protein
MQSCGIDSQVGIQLRSWLQKTIGVEVAMFEIIGGTSLFGCTCFTDDKEGMGRKEKLRETVSIRKSRERTARAGELVGDALKSHFSC